ncbi:MAG TPA: hypothetical protein VFD01_03875 [Candidatus Dormibacteraeota bacterium]|jgi:hypothetical protein|nr:hypothetical protein [Candidatus Dormibacteraeota bacterium]
MGRYLVVANLTAESPSLRARAAEIVAEDPQAEFVILVPAGEMGLWHHLLGIEDSPIRLGRRRAGRARRRLQAVGARVTSVRLSPHGPAEAIEEELRYGGYDAVIISTLPHPLSHWLRRDLPGQVARAHPDLRVVQVTAPADLYLDELGPVPPQAERRGA